MRHKKDKIHHLLQPKYFVEICTMAMCSFVLNSFFLLLAGDHNCSLNGARKRLLTKHLKLKKNGAKKN
jgi:hypothetical protein